VFGGMICAKQDIKSVSTTGETTFWGHPSSYVVTGQTGVIGYLVGKKTYQIVDLCVRMSASFGPKVNVYRPNLSTA
jgi:hypothetical protein